MRVVLQYIWYKIKSNTKDYLVSSISDVRFVFYLSFHLHNMYCLRLVMYKYRRLSENPQNISFRYFFFKICIRKSTHKHTLFSLQFILSCLHMIITLSLIHFLLFILAFVEIDYTMITERLCRIDKIKKKMSPPI